MLEKIPDNRYLLCRLGRFGRQTAMGLLDLQTGVLLKKKGFGPPTGYGPNTISLQQNMRYWRIEYNREQHPGGTDRSILSLRDFNSGKVIREISLNGAADSISPDGEQALARVREGNPQPTTVSYRIIDLTNGHELQRITAMHNSNMLFSPDHRYLVAWPRAILPAEAAKGTKLFLWDTQTGHLLRTIDLSALQQCFKAFFSPDSSFLIYQIYHQVGNTAGGNTSWGGSTFTITDIRSGAMLSTLQVDSWHVAITQDNRFLLATRQHDSGEDSDSIDIRDIHSGKLVTSITDSPSINKGL